MSCKCGGSCDCGSSCNCGRNPSLGFSEEAAAASITVRAIIAGVAPVKMYGGEKLEKSAEGGHGCKCGSSCSCDPCKC